MSIDFVKIIWMLWHSGLDNAPSYVKLVHKSWVEHNPEYTVRLLNLSEAEQLAQQTRRISEARWSQLTIQAKSDVLRTFLLYDHGGVWADASVLCNGPLRAWAPENRFFTFVRRDAGARQYKNHGRALSPWITSWFLSAGKVHSRVMTPVFSAVLKFVNSEEEQLEEYFWWHRLVAELHYSNRDFRRALNVSTLPNADGPHCFKGNYEKQWVLKRCWRNKNVRKQLYLR
jgi:hypothetical protein